MVPVAGRVLRAGNVTSKHIAPPAPWEGEHYERCCPSTPFGACWPGAQQSSASVCPSPNILPHPSASSLPGTKRRVSQKRGWQLEAYMSLRGWGGRSLWAASEEMTGDRSTEAFQCREVPHVQDRWANPHWRGCYLGAHVTSGLWSCHGVAVAPLGMPVRGEGQHLLPLQAAHRLWPGREGGDHQL